ncbi:C-type mannose receptor 2-like [Syngnathus acus]|uniref:C-type mannose receptor 2-like n=1 Tax=Syngnathus acus TaxID=161584 RepID=UPI0018860C68|nr:C-type mannose receptor 2-like [Syngnathus acus]
MLKNDQGNFAVSSGSIKACDNGWTLHGSHCYKKAGTTNGWQGARYDCALEGGDLVSITDETVEDFVKRQMGDKPFWIGLSNLNCDEDWCEFAGAKELTWSNSSMTLDYTNWDTRQNGSSNVESCAYVNQGVPTYNQPGKWRYGSCGSSLAYMCERPLDACSNGRTCSHKESASIYYQLETSFCDSGDFLYKDSCYHFGETRATWQAAEDFCKNKGGHLASVHSQVDGQFLAAHARAAWSWLGLRRNNGKFEWSDGSSTNDVPWHSGGDRNDCVQSESDGRVYSFFCSELEPRICQKGKARNSFEFRLAPTSESGPIIPEPTCNAKVGWTLHGSHCYKKMAPTNGWLGARYDCLWEGGDLVSITSKDEEDFVKRQMGDKPFWIGLSNLNCDEAWCQFSEAGEKLLTWSDTDVTPTYTNRDSRQDGSSNVESCAYVNQGVHFSSQPGKWRHGSCGSSLPYMCERSPDDCPEGRLCSYKDYGLGYHRVETSYCDTGDFLYKGSCYHFEGVMRTWEGAETFCGIWRGHLASVLSWDEGKFLAAHAPYAGGYQSWVGLKKNKGNFEWSDATPTGKIEWVPDRPAGRGDCAALSQTGKLEDRPCTNARPFICKKAKVQDFLLPLPAGWSSKCAWWLERSSSDFCYLIQRKPTKTWEEARDDCLHRGGDLLSIADSQEHTFIQGLYTLLPSAPSLWLGVNNNVTKDGSGWTDGSPLGYVVTDGVDPGDLSAASCLSLLTSNGRWKFDDCRKKRGYMCKKRGNIPKPPQQPHDALIDPKASCDAKNGWNPHGSNCYKKMEKTNGWLGARQDCLWEGGDLVSITSKDEESFVKKQMGDKPFWIGLSNLDCNKDWCQFFEEGEKKLTWSDTGVTPAYANRDSRQDGSSHLQSCAYVNQGVHSSSQPGKWRHGSCGSSLAYMCKRSPDDCPEGRLCSYKDYGFGYHRVETSASFCDPGDFLYKGSCYHFWEKKRTWEDAEKFCRESKGHLASVHSLDEVQFLAGHMPYKGGLQSWVGLKKHDRMFEWRDATPAGNIEWVPHGPVGRGDCAALSLTGKLEDWPCTDILPFICKKAKVQDFLLPPPAGRSAKCGWWQNPPSSDFCYLIQHRPTKAWKEARDDCLRHGGDLLSIADSSLYTFLPSAPSLWLGINNNITKYGSGWTDGSPLGYVVMDEGDPGDPSGASCLSLLTSNGRWRFDDCRKKRGYMCKKRGNIPKPPQQPHDVLTDPKATCDISNGWNPHASKCYKKMEKTNGWLGARHDCLWEGGDLVSISSIYEESFVKKQMGDKPFWIGLSNLDCNKDWCQFFEEGEKKLTWSDTGVTPAYANRDSRQDGSSNIEACAYVNQGVHSSSQPGKWRHGSCGSSLAYMCKRSPDDCPDGWPCSYKDLGYRYNRVETSFCDSGEFLYKDSCYHFEGTRKTWQEAEGFCKNKGGHLASLHSLVVGQFLFAHVRRDGQGWLAWLGLWKNNGNFEWSDTSSPDDVPWYNSYRSSECSKLAFDGNAHLTQCDTLRPSICQKGKAREFLPLLLTPTSASGKSAKCGWWQENPANDFCYLINSKATKTWKEARDKCARLSGNLLGFADSQERAFIQEKLVAPSDKDTSQTSSALHYG